MSVPAPSAAPSDSVVEPVPLKTRVLWGFGGLADNFMFNTMTALGTLIYVNHFKMSPLLAGVALALPRIVDALTDPLVGNWSDNTRSRFGRRRPFMLVGVLLSAFILPFLWTPVGLETLGNPWYSNLPFLYIVAVGSLLSCTSTLFAIPYTALGYELTPHYDERTKVMAWRMYIGLPGSIAAGWLFRLTAADFFPNVAVGAVWVSVGVAVIVVVSGLIPTFGCREAPQAVSSDPPISFWAAWGATLTNRPFLILFVAYVTIIIATCAAQSIAPLLLQHHVFGGSEKAVGTFQGWLMTMAVAISYVSLFLIAKISALTSKRIAMITGLSLVLLGTMGNFFAIDPRWPHFLYAAAAVTFLGMQGCWLMVSSMVADVCDDDELKTGRRSEGMFGAVIGFAQKVAQGLTFGIGGYLATYAGFDALTVAETGLSDEIAFRMKSLLIGFQSVGLILAITFMAFYPISRAKAAETRRLLALRRAAS
jgi:GPH family glycoside/pentoside/hexuronide:cation symporter